MYSSNTAATAATAATATAKGERYHLHANGHQHAPR
jgi:hypothetical protein